MAMIKRPNIDLHNSKQKKTSAQHYPTNIGFDISHELNDRYEIFISQMPMGIFPFTKIAITIIGIYYE
jgi:hypothetical protein